MLPRTLMPSLQELTAFEAAGRHGSFTKAAQELSLTQSAISKQVRQLEETLGVVLFNRAKGRVVLTSLGEDYIRFATRMLRDCATATHAVIAAGGGESMLKIAVLPTFAARWLIPRLTPYLAAHPSLSLSVTTELEPFDFDERPADVAIHYGAPTWPRAEAVYLFDETIIAVASPVYAAAKALTDAADLDRAILLQQATRPGLWQDWFETAAVEHPNAYRGPIFDQFAMTIEAAAAGLGVALAPAFMVERELAAGQLVRLGKVALAGPGAYYAVTPLSKRYDPAVRGFVDWLVETARA